MFGLILSDPGRDAQLREKTRALLAAQQIPLTGFTEEPAAALQTRTAFLRGAAEALLRPGVPLRAEDVLRELSGDALPGNVLRRYLFLQLSLMPYLRPGRAVREGEGCFLLGEDVLIAPVSPEDRVEAQLPPGAWTDLQDGTVYRGRLRLMRGYNAMPVLARENVLLPIGVNDRSPDADDADRLTLHWFQPGDAADCVLADGTRYAARRAATGFTLETTSEKPWHLIVHEDGEELLVR